MFHKENPDYNRKQYGFYTIDELAPKDHFLRQVDSKVDFGFKLRRFKNKILYFSLRNSGQNSFNLI